MRRNRACNAIIRLWLATASLRLASVMSVFLLVVMAPIAPAALVFHTIHLTVGSAAPASPTQKDWPTGIVYLTSSSNGFWTMFEGSPHASLDYTWLWGYRGRAGVNDIIPDDDATYDWSHIDNAVAVIGAHGKKIGLSFNTGTIGTPRRWYFDASPVPYIVVDEADATATEEFTDATFTSGSPIVTSAKGFFISQDETKRVIAPGFICDNVPACGSSTTTIVSVDSLTQFTMSTNAIASGTNKSYQIVARTQLQPVYWNATYRSRYRTFIQALAARYDGNPYVGYFTIQGFMQTGEMYIAKTPAGDIAWDARAVTDGFVDKSAAYVPAAKGIIDDYLSYFSATPCFLTLARPWDNNTAADTDKNAINNYGHASYPGWYGEMIASLHGILPVNQSGTLPNLPGYPKIGQAISASSDICRFYTPALPGPTPPGCTPGDPQPAAPQPMDDMLIPAAKDGRQAVEVYAGDCNTSANWTTFATDSLILEANR